LGSPNAARQDFQFYLDHVPADDPLREEVERLLSGL
jgi:hypothetical protein